MKLALVPTLAGLLPLVAMSHTGSAAQGHDVLAGFFHPLLSADHLAAMLTVSLWIGLALRCYASRRTACPRPKAISCSDVLICHAH